MIIQDDYCSREIVHLLYKRKAFDDIPCVKVNGLTAVTHSLVAKWLRFKGWQINTDCYWDDNTFGIKWWYALRYKGEVVTTANEDEVYGGYEDMMDAALTDILTQMEGYE